ncbi:hypothetical protein Syun_019445 [Stephania yunnanensis]|uniref:Uncharacterized protein n=1 Tax=Stephania yunnanensis TaxID=152371 RepID=A0AAP0IU61_9MAGN
MVKCRYWFRGDSRQGCIEPIVESEKRRVTKVLANHRGRHLKSLSAVLGYMSFS